MEQKQEKELPVLSTALLKVKTIHHSINPESIPFEDYVMSSNTSIKIDFPDGRSLMEKEFRKINAPLDKFYFEDFDSSSMLDYLTDEKSNFRVTSLEGSVIRLSHEDFQAIPKEIKEDTSDEPLKEYVFVPEKVSIFQKIKKIIHKKAA